MHVRIGLGLVIGAAAGAIAHAAWPGSPVVEGLVTYVSRPIGQVFLRLLFLLAWPLVFSALALGIAEIGNPARLGRIGLKTLLVTAAMSAMAVAIGVTVVNVIRPGVGLSEEVRATLLDGAAERAATITSGPAVKSGVDLLVKIVPDNLVKVMAEGDMLAVIFAALVLGIGFTLVETPASFRFREALQGVYDIAMRLLEIVIRLAPIGVAALMFTIAAQLGFSVLVQLGWYVATVLLGLALHQFLVYPFAVGVLGGMHPVRFFAGIQEAMFTAFSTASSSATLPTTLRVARELGLPPQIARFVLTVGATANQNGTALFEGVTVLFLAQFYGIDLTLGQQLLVAGISVLGGIGTAGVPAGSLPVIIMILGMIGVPAEGIGLILGVDRLLDMCRTTLNVTGDLAAAVVVSRGEEVEPEPA